MNAEQYQEKKTAFSSPIPILQSIKRLIYGVANPSLPMRIMVYLHLLIFVVFFIWHLLSFFAIDMREIILSEKHINVEVMILNRGSALGYDPSQFLNNLLNFNRLSILYWIAVFVSSVFMWRKKKVFFYILLAAILCYYGSMIFFLGSTFYLEDTTAFDKISVIILFVNSCFYLLLLNRQDGSDNFFEAPERSQPTISEEIEDSEDDY
ncbi:MAG: hypothetical protein EP338_12240 [Bacteroidetes bacterium]|nr:MAG: hypothetical protein EP338_12240 [Bacteroidota bacterium]